MEDENEKREKINDEMSLVGGNPLFLKRSRKLYFGRKKVVLLHNVADMTSLIRLWLPIQGRPPNFSADRTASSPSRIAPEAIQILRHGHEKLI